MTALRVFVNTRVHSRKHPAVMNTNAEQREVSPLRRHLSYEQSAWVNNQVSLRPFLNARVSIFSI